MPRRNKNLLRNPCAKENLPSRSTSQQPCENFQLIYLPEFDISEEILDKKKPPIRIRDWYGARNVCGCEYTIRVRLLADDKSTELDVWNFEDTQEECSGWKKVKHVFQDYPPGVRYVEFKHGGQNTKIWTGHYGAKMTNSGVFVGKKRGNRKKRAVREKLGKNLLKNPCASSDLEGWTIVSDGEWACEEKPAGCKPVKANAEDEGKSCWATSYKDCEKKQVIDLDFEGFDSDYMDEIGPKIKFSEWFGSRADAGCVYWLTVRLLNSDMKTVYEKVIKETKVAEGHWYKVEGSFGSYGPGVRFIEYSHGGRDTCYWAGNFGAKITCSFVAVVAEAETSSSSDEN